MALWKPDPTFYPSPKMAMQAAPEKLAYVAVVSPKMNGRPDALALDLSSTVEKVQTRCVVARASRPCVTDWWQPGLSLQHTGDTPTHYARVAASSRWRRSPASASQLRRFASATFCFYS